MNPVKPAWLTKHFIQKALENGKENSVTIEDLKIDMPVPKGNNYTSDIFGAKIKFRKLNDSEKEHNTSLIIKAPIKGEQYEKMIENGILRKEVSIYNELSPKLNNIFGENYDDEENDSKLLPKSFISTEPYVIVLEDLKQTGYKMADRFEQLDFDHCVLAFKSLAKFHAGSVLIHEKEPEFIEKTVGYEIAFTNDKEFNLQIKNFTTSCSKLFSEALQDWPELKKYSSWFENNAANVWNMLVDSVKPNKEEFNVLNHGDFWVSNMLFKYNENNKPIKVKLIDLQMPRYTSPVIDFMYFVEASVQENVRKEHLDDLVTVYLNELNSILENYGSSRRLYESDFRKTLTERAVFRIQIILIVLPFVIADPKKTELLNARETSMDDLGSIDKNPVKGYYKNEKFIKIISKSLEELHNLGVITAKH